MGRKRSFGELKIMFQIPKALSLFVLIVMVSISGVDASGKPSAGAEGMDGAKGAFDFKPQDWMEGSISWWKDSDGVSPAVAGCHIGTDAEGNPNGRMFGEACLPDGLLVESNPASLELHSHVNDVGHPDKFDCNAWCIGEGASGGVCRAAPAPPCAESAFCACN